MKIASRGTLTLRKVLLLAALLSACQAERRWPDATNADRLARFELECGYSASFPSRQDELETLFAQRGTRTYVEHPGQNVFPLEKAPEIDHGAVVLAIVAICDDHPPTYRPAALGDRSARYAFYVDEHGVVFHVEDRSLYLG